MELKELVDRTLETFGASKPEELGQALIESRDDAWPTYDAFCDLVGGDLSKDWMQMIYQYYLADRKEKKQDYTPASVAKLMSSLAGGGCERDDWIIDLCAGSGALTIQHWLAHPNCKYICYEVDSNVIPFLLFNLAIRNIEAVVLQCDVLSGEKPSKGWTVTKAGKYGKITDIKSTV